MAKYAIPDVPKSYLYSLSDLLGVDYNDTVADNRRSPKMENFVNNNGFLESRHGHRILINIDNAKINGVWNIDANNDVFVVHCGTKLYEVNSTFNAKVLIQSDLPDKPSCGIYYDGNLILLTGKKALIYHKVGAGWVVDKLEDVGYVPTTSIARNPDGTNSRTLDGINQFSAWRINQFLADGESTEYHLDGESWATDKPIVSQMTNEGGIIIIDKDTYTWNNSTGVVNFNTAPEKSPVAGRDNIFIRFKTTDVTNYINGCTFGVLYGYEGNNNRLFVSGNAEYPNVDWYSYIDDPTYFPVDNYAKIGTQPIVGYSRVGDGSLAIHKKISDTDCTVYYRTYNSYGGEQIFPLTAGVKNIGCLTYRCCENFLNDPVFLSELGVYSMVSVNNVTDEKFADERSYYINYKLLNEYNLENAVAIVNKDKYYLAVNNKVYMADKRFLSKSSRSVSGYQYEWFLLTNMNVTCWFNWNNNLYWGDEQGNIRTWSSDYLDDVYVDGEITRKPVEVYWESDYIYFNNYTQAKTVRRVFAHHNPKGETRIRLSYIDVDGLHEISVSEYDGTSTYPKTIQEKEKISKIMCCKFVIDNDENSRCSFNNVIVEYRIAGKYRGD